MNLILFLVTLIVSFIAVRVGAIAFQLTGLEWSLAKFQALSCFSGTGFTTREAELIVGHPRRRQIASVLMVMGNAGLVTLIATFANSMRPRIAVGAASSLVVRNTIPIMNLAIIAVAIAGAHLVLTRSRLGRHLTEFLKARVKRSGVVAPVSFEELMIATGGYGVTRAQICEGNPLVGRTLATSELRNRDITVLAVKRGEVSTPNPKPDTLLQEGDTVLCFGQLDSIRAVFFCGTSQAPIDGGA